MLHALNHRGPLSSVFRLLAIVLLAVSTAACTSARERRSAVAKPIDLSAVTSAGAAAEVSPLGAGDDAEAGAAAPARPMVREGSGRLVNLPPAPAARAGEGEPRSDINLNFQDAALSEVVNVILGDLLGETYFMDPQVQGTVTVRNETPLTSDMLLPILESLLGMNGAALVRADGGFRILPLGQAARSALPPETASLARAGQRGYGLHVIPLRYASAEEVAGILEPYVPEGGSLRPLPSRNVLLLAAPGRSVGEFLATVRVFDADWLEGMSMAMLPLTFASAQTVSEELRQILDLDGESPLRGLLRIIPVERLNSLLVVTPQRDYLDAVREWVSELDRGGDGQGRRLWVYEVQYGNADHIAGVLSQVFALEGGEQGADAPVAERDTLAPGQEPATIGSVQGTQGQSVRQTTSPGIGTVTQVIEGLENTTPPLPRPEQAVAQAGAAVRGGPTAATESDFEGIRITPDPVNNTLLVLATRAGYAAVEPTIKRLDVLPRQVLVEATVAEIQLTDNLRYGIQWFLKGGIGRFNVEFRSLTGDETAIPGAAAPGLSAAVFPTPGDVRLFLDALETESNVRVLSAPQVLVSDNRTANIRVGTQVPVTTRRSSGAETGTTVVQEIEFRDTGVLLTVKPRINAGGMVTLEVSNEVSSVGQVVGTTGNVSIDQRRVDSSISVQSGETIVLGGLITERDTDSTSGVPVLSKLPVVGPLFGTRTLDTTRNELIVLITPTVISTPEEARAVTRELRERLRAADI